jgi:ribosomal protein L11 methyltransferase
MSLRLLEELTRTWSLGWSLADLGTGSGILALAAKAFGAHPVVGIDNDPMAISAAKNNARRNHLRGVEFQLCDVRFWKPLGKLDIVCANLFSELVIDLVPKLRRANWLILSGILRQQENEIVCRLRRNRLEIVKTRRRGKWIAILARSVTPAARIGS